MKCFKFVTEDLCSPGGYKVINYSDFGKKITLKRVASKDFGQCSTGIHVIPYKNKIDFENVTISRKIIILEVDPKDIVYQNEDKTGKMRVKAATPVRLANKREINHIRKLICKSLDPRVIYAFALKFDKEGRDDTRNAICSSCNIKNEYMLYMVLDYAKWIDKKSHPVTRDKCHKVGYLRQSYNMYFPDIR